MMDLASELRKIPLLQDNLSDEEIDKLALADGVRLEHRRQGEVVIESGTAGDLFYIVLAGQLRVHSEVEGKKVVLNYLSEGDFCGEVALLTGKPRIATVDVIEDAYLAVFDKAVFGWLIKHPGIKAQLESITEQREKPPRKEFPGQQEHEIVLAFERRHIFALLERIFIPTLVITFLVFIGYEVDLFLRSPIHVTILTAAPAIVVAILLGLYFYMDWANDHFIVTSERVIHIERIIFYSESRDEAPLERVQDVKLVRPNFLYRLLGFHDVIVKTAGAGSFVFTESANGELIKNTIFSERAKALQRRSAADRERIRRELRYRLGLEEGKEAPPIEPQPKQPPERPLLGRLDYFLPHLRIVDAERNQITWRKHWIILARRTILQLLASLGAFGLLITFLSLPYPFFTVAALIILPVTLFWLVWQYEDWRNDIYVITPDSLIDIKRTPFGVLGESRRTGAFDAVQDVTYEIPSFIHQLLNLGNVDIQMTGQADPFKFHQVFDPSGVQQEIFDRFVEFQERHRQEEHLRTIKDLGIWFDQYNILVEKMQREGGES
jgi:uncharacterized membrane protein YdbT with pleckstrin-like domain